MKITPFKIVIFSCFFPLYLNAIPTATAPSDIVLSCKQNVDLQLMKSNMGSPYGNIVLDISDQRTIVTKDIVCEQYCHANKYTGYPGGMSGSNSVPDRACSYYESLFDPLHPHNIFILDWGKDGIASSSKPLKIKITITDQRKCNQGLIIRNFNVSDQDGAVNVQQFIWIVQCDPYNVSEEYCNDTLKSDIVWPPGVCDQKPIRLHSCISSFEPSNPELGEPKIVENTSNCSMISITFSDELYNIQSDYCFKIDRKWLVIDWCQYDPLINPSIGRWEKIQTIEVEDNHGPSINYPDSIHVEESNSNCLGYIKMTVPGLSDDCSKVITYTFESFTGNVTGDQNTGYTITNLPKGYHTVSLIAQDVCGNKTTKKVVLSVTVARPSQISCIQNLNLSLNGLLNSSINGLSISADDITITSNDSCNTTFYKKIIRQEQLQKTQNGSNVDQAFSNCTEFLKDDDRSTQGHQIYFDDSTYVCCNDIFSEITMILRVFTTDPGEGPILPERMNDSSGDLYGKFTDCITNVQIVNAIDPEVVAPPDIVVSCEFKFDITKLKDANDPTFGKIVNNPFLREKVFTHDIVCKAFCENNKRNGYPGKIDSTISPKPVSNMACDHYYQLYDTTNKTKKYMLEWGLDGYVTGNCAMLPHITVKDERVCGTGKITRTITSYGKGNTPISDSQTIWVIDCVPFSFTPQGRSYSISSCAPNSDSIVKFIFNIDSANIDCTFLSADYQDTYKTLPDSNYCYVVYRNWKVIDWCQFNPKIPEIGIWEFTDTIAIKDLIKPTCKFNIGTCHEIDSISASGQEFHQIDLLLSVLDNCTVPDFIRLEYSIDLFNDGSVDCRVGPLTMREFKNGIKPQFSTNLFAINNNNPFDASGQYPVGDHILSVVATDGCGNVESKNFSIQNMIDSINPTPFCQSQTITIPMPPSGCLTLWAVDFNLGSFDNCTAKDELIYYFDKKEKTVSTEFCCKNLKIKSNQAELDTVLKIWVEDRSGNSDFCNVKVRIVDLINYCDPLSIDKPILRYELEFFPNPTEGQVTIRKSNVDLIIQDIKVVNTLNGLSHFETSGFTAKENEIKLYLDDIPAGVYYIQLQTNKGQMTKKIVKMQ